MRTIGLCFFIAGQGALAAVAVWLNCRSLEASMFPGPVVTLAAGPGGAVQVSAPALAVAAGLAMTLLAFKFALAGGARWGGGLGVIGLVIAASASIALSFDALYRTARPDFAVSDVVETASGAAPHSPESAMPIADLFAHLAQPGAFGVDAAVLLALAAAIHLSDLAGIALLARRPEPGRSERLPLRRSRPATLREPTPAHLTNRRRESPFVEPPAEPTDVTVPLAPVEKAVRFGRRRRMRR